MPKVITREKDLTSAGSFQYSNFTVLVPGFIAADKAKAYDAYIENQGYYEVADGVAEFTTFADFKNAAGLTTETNVSVKFAEATEITAGDLDIVDANIDSIFTQLSLDTILNNNLKDIIYTVKAIAEPAADKGENILKFKVNDDNFYYECTKFDLTNATWATTEGEAYLVAATQTGAPDGFAFIEDGNLGNDGSTISHYGNKIAGELLNLGYTVLYKKIDKSITELEDPEFWKPLKDRAVYDFRYVLTGLLKDNIAASRQIRDLCKFNLPDNSDATELTGRGDCFALIDIDESLYESESPIDQFAAVEAIKNSDFYTEFADEDGKYVALCSPSVKYVTLPNNKYYVNADTKMPASFHYLACAAKSLARYREWYAIAGYTRGVSDLTIKSLTVNFGDYAVNALQPRKREVQSSAINLICKVRNNYYLWGNRTAFYDEAFDKSPVGLVASDFLNIRQLCTTIKKTIYYASKRFTFDPNSDILWTKFTGAISPTLELMKTDQGIEDYKFTKLATDQKGKLKARIRIIPIEAVEDFDICLTLEDSISGTVVSFED